MQRNSLAESNSPYLLQHSTNPVNWYPWGDEAFAQARRRDKPIFLSIGYATCHWCHVMEHESFEDPDVAELINDAFVAVKVDREERPDVDQIYMNACQIAGGRCGWPLTVFATPDRKPFFVATYIPRQTRPGQMGMLELLPRIAQVWKDDRSRIDASADELTTMLASTQSLAPGSEPAASHVPDVVFESLRERYDSENGGFGSAPKFPTAHNLLFLIERSWTAPGNGAEMVAHTLTRIRQGGIYDQIGNGVHRYATDREWRLPHFEKMLYDQAMLCLACVECSARVGSPALLGVALEILEYVERDLGHPDGPYYTAEDADSEGEEGTFYTWTTREIKEVLGAASAADFMRVHGVEERGNYRDEATGSRTGRNVILGGHLHESVPSGNRSGEFFGSDDSVHGWAHAKLDRERHVLFERRALRPRPLLDDKVLTDWNGLTVAAFARAGSVSGDDRFVERSASAANWLLENMVDDGQLLHAHRAGKSHVAALLDDYAFLIWGLIELHQATGTVRWLREALRLTMSQLELFEDPAGGAFFLTSAHAENLLYRPKEPTDGALPSGNSATIYNLARLFALTGKVDFRTAADRALAAASGLAERYPSAFGGLGFAAQVLAGPSTEIVVAGAVDNVIARAMHERARALGSRRCVVHWKSPENADDLSELAPFTRPMDIPDDGASAFICAGGVCALPVGTLADFEAALKRHLAASET